MKLYNEHVENFGVRVIYLFNTINSFCVLSSIFALLFAYYFLPFPILFIEMIIAAFVSFALMKISDWHPYYVPFAIISMIYLSFAYNPNLDLLFAAFCGIFIFYLGVLIFINGGPQLIVGRDWTIPFRMLPKTLNTIVPTTLSMPISVFFGFLFTFNILITQNSFSNEQSLIPLFITFLINTIIVVIIRKKLPDNIPANQYQPKNKIKKPFKKVVILNIDGGRWDMIQKLKLPNMQRVIKNGSHVKNGLLTVYRALTNSAFGTILTGARPQEHGIFDNNFGQSLKVEGLGDLAKITIYGCMHMKHFAKDGWETKIVSLPEVGIQKSDDVSMKWLLDDLKNDKKTQIFVFDYSEADFCGHSYGGQSKQYIDALKKVDLRIGKALDVIDSLKDSSDIAVIICADHGMHNLDHGYRLFKGESFVPCLFYGKRIKKGHVVMKDGMINDICMTASWMLGKDYPSHAQGQVFDEVVVN
jgi:hypothetical protein